MAAYGENPYQGGLQAPRRPMLRNNQRPNRPGGGNQGGMSRFGGGALRRPAGPGGPGGPGKFPGMEGALGAFRGWAAKQPQGGVNLGMEQAGQAAPTPGYAGPSAVGAGRAQLNPNRPMWEGLNLQEQLGGRPMPVERPQPGGALEPTNPASSSGGQWQQDANLGPSSGGGYPSYPETASGGRGRWRSY